MYRRINQIIVETVKVNHTWFTYILNKGTLHHISNTTLELIASMNHNTTVDEVEQNEQDSKG